METLPFATKPLQSSLWGNSHATDVFKTSENFAPSPQSNKIQHNQEEEASQEPVYPSNHFEYMPAVLLNSLKREKKPFTYTPGRLDLSEVLNAKLQKRIERKKKHYEEKLATQSSPEPVFNPPKQVLIMPTYNSPLDMYSMENALEALEVQAEIAVAEKSLSSPQRTQTLPRNYKYEVKDFEPKNVTQSKAFKVLQIITDTEQPEGKIENNASHHVDEMVFKGTGQQQTVPSKYFHTLQKMTGTENISDSETLNHNKVFQNNSDHLYIEPRFTGLPQSKIIPSRYFHNLQRLTGTEESDSASPQMHESKVYENSPHHFQSETRFTGTGSKVIPSKYFQSLQRITGTDEGNQTSPHIQESMGVYGAPGNIQNAAVSSANRPVTNERPFTFQPKSFSANANPQSIPVLQRPAAFLSSTKKASNLKRSTTAPRSVRFCTPDMQYSEANSTCPYEGTDF